MSEERLINLLFVGLLLQDEKKLCSVMLLMIKINENILSNFDTLVTPKLIQEDPMNIFFANNNFDNESILNDSNKIETQKKILTLLFHILKENEFIFLNDLNLYKNLFFKSTFEKEQERLGIKKLTQVEYFRTIIDIFVNAYAKGICNKEIEELILLAKNKKIFTMISDLYFKFELNNLYHTLYIQIMTIITNKNSPQILIESFFNEKLEQTQKNLFDSLIDNLLNNLNFEFTNNRKSFSCFFANNIQLITLIFKSENNYLKSIMPMNFKVINEVFVYHINNFFEQKLLYMEPTNFEFDVEIPTSNSTLEELVEEDLKVYNVYLNGGDYKKANMDKLLMLGSKKKNQEEEAKEEKLNELSFEDVNDDINGIIDINKHNDNEFFDINENEKENNINENNEKDFNSNISEEKIEKNDSNKNNENQIEENNDNKATENENGENNMVKKENKNDNNNEENNENPVNNINNDEKKEGNDTNIDNKKNNDTNSPNKKDNDTNIDNKGDNDTNIDNKGDNDTNIDNKKNNDINSPNKKDNDTNIDNKKNNDINIDNKKNNDINSENKKDNDINKDNKKENDITIENKIRNDTNNDFEKKENNTMIINEIKDKNDENKTGNEIKEDKIELNVENNDIKVQNENVNQDNKKEKENIHDNKKENEIIQDNKKENENEESKINENTENVNQIKIENSQSNIVENLELNQNENKEEKKNEAENN